MEPLLTRIGFAGFRWRRRAIAPSSPLRVVERLAERYGFVYRDPAWSGNVDGYQVLLAPFKDRVQVSFYLPDDQPEDFAIVLDSERPIPPWPFPAEDLVISGDPRFDTEAHVVGNPVDALARLDRTTRENLRAWPGLTLHRRRLAVSLAPQRLADQFMGTLRALRHTVDYLCIADEARRPRLEARLSQGREPVGHQQAVLQALAQAGWLEHELLRRLLEHPLPPIRIEAATLAPTDDADAAEALWSMLRDPRVSPSWRAEAVHRWMARAPAERRLSALNELLDARFPEVKAASCFWWAQQPDARDILARWLKDTAPDVRAAAMVALSSLTSVLKPHEEAAIIRTLHTYPEATVVQAALQALRVGGTRSIEAVRAFLSSCNASPEARRAARATLKALQIRRQALPGRLGIVEDDGKGRLSPPSGQAA